MVKIMTMIEERNTAIWGIGKGKTGDNVHPRHPGAGENELACRFIG
jgi:hypothetical protein